MADFPMELVEPVLGPRPDGHPGAMRQLADAHAATAERSRALAQGYRNSAASTRASLGGDTGARVAAYQERIAAALDGHADYSDSLAQQLYQGANTVEEGQFTWAGMGVVLVAQLAADAMMLQAGAVKAVEDRAAARVGWRRFLGGRLAGLAASGRTFMVSRAGMLTTAGVLGAAAGAVVPVLAEERQIRAGHREHLDGQTVVTGLLSGLAGGLGGAAVASAAGPMVQRWLGRVVRDSRLSTVLGTLALGAAGGAGGAVPGVLAASLTTAAYTGKFSLSGRELTNNLTIGIVGGMVGGVTGMVHAARAAHPTFVDSAAVHPVPSLRGHLGPPIGDRPEIAAPGRIAAGAATRPTSALGDPAVPAAGVVGAAAPPATTGGGRGAMRPAVTVRGDGRDVLMIGSPDARATTAAADPVGTADPVVGRAPASTEESVVTSDPVVGRASASAEEPVVTSDPAVPTASADTEKRTVAADPTTAEARAAESAAPELTENRIAEHMADRGTVTVPFDPAAAARREAGNWGAAVTESHRPVVFDASRVLGASGVSAVPAERVPVLVGAHPAPEVPAVHTAPEVTPVHTVSEVPGNAGRVGGTVDPGSTVANPPGIHGSSPDSPVMSGDGGGRGRPPRSAGGGRDPETGGWSLGSDGAVPGSGRSGHGYDMATPRSGGPGTSGGHDLGPAGRSGGDDAGGRRLPHDDNEFRVDGRDGDTVDPAAMSGSHSSATESTPSQRVRVRRSRPPDLDAGPTGPGLSAWDRKAPHMVPFNYARLDENRAATLMARAGYSVEQVPRRSSGGRENISFRIDGEPFGFLRPETSSMANIVQRLERLGGRVVVSLRESPFSATDLATYMSYAQPENISELIVVGEEHGVEYARPLYSRGTVPTAANVPDVFARLRHAQGEAVRMPTRAAGYTWGDVRRLLPDEAQPERFSRPEPNPDGFGPSGIGPVQSSGHDALLRSMMGVRSEPAFISGESVTALVLHERSYYAPGEVAELSTIDYRGEMTSGARIFDIDGHLVTYLGTDRLGNERLLTADGHEATVAELTGALPDSTTGTSAVVLHDGRWVTGLGTPRTFHDGRILTGTESHAEPAPLLSGNELYEDVSRDYTVPFDPDLIHRGAAQGHDMWRFDLPLDADGRAPEVWVPTTDQDWIAANGTDRVELVGTDYWQLPADAQRNCQLSVEVAVDVASRLRDGGHDLAEPQVRETIADEVHLRWLNRKFRTARPDQLEPYRGMVPGEGLSEAERDKDRVYADIAIALLTGSFRAG
ncbi:hypothetical protein [Nocardia aurantia]|uniref:Uncharacterized protein n=1 Tax=Nocardia aurantia TaxID=2585199 RepID=A0A7K0DIB1_9NOCA|nr:hypothetical protein [Nocardia aurantia]MQY25022.1 hypothetical protein [Nocardia aurantia]